MQRTTIRLDEHLLIRVKEYAITHGKTFTAVVEEALRAQLEPRQAVPRRAAAVRLPVSKQKGGLQPGIETWDDIKRVLEEEEIENFKRVMREDAAARR